MMNPYRLPDVTPAKAGVHRACVSMAPTASIGETAQWIPAFAGMTDGSPPCHRKQAAARQ
jgi:hypothetical protein